MVAVNGDVIVASPRRRVRARFSPRENVVYGVGGGSDCDSVLASVVVASGSVSILEADGDVSAGTSTGGGGFCCAISMDRI